MKILLLNPIGMPDEELAGHVGALARFAPAHYEVTTGREDYQRWFPFDGSWEAWAQAAAGRYDAFVIWASGLDDVKAGNRAVMSAALRQGKSVGLWSGGVEIIPVVSAAGDA